MSQTPIVVNGWQLYLHPRFVQQLEDLNQKVNKLRQKYPEQYQQKALTKRRAAIIKLILEVIPQNPELPEYRQGDTLGSEYKSWFRSKFFQQYRLFFRYNKESQIIVFGWVNDENTKRAYGSKTDAYRVFRKMLDSGNPPDDWETLLAEATTVDLEGLNDF